MKSKWTVLFFAGIAFLIGALAATVYLGNPRGWKWADVLTGRLHGAKAPAPAAESNAGGEKKERKIKYWRAPMDPNYISDKPGKSPMGMDLIPVYEDEAKETGIRVDPSFLQSFAIRTVKAQIGSIPVDIRTIGILDYNQKNVSWVNTKFEGWIEKAYVNYVGEPVKKGQLLFEVYSPQLVTTEEEFLSTATYVDKLAGQKADPDAIERARSLLGAAAERLHYWDISDDQIAQLRQSGKIIRRLKIFSPVSGLVVAKGSDSLEGMKLTPGMNVYQIADLSTLWAQIEVYEDQIRYMRVGRSSNITIDAFPNRHWTGKVIYIDPAVDPKTRTLKVSVEIPNSSLALRPQMYANVEFHVPAVSNVVKIPEEAILHSGEQSIVIVEKSKGLFDPRTVEIGALGDGYREIREGLRAGETVVTSSQFLIDSESNLREAAQKMLSQRKGGADRGSMPANAGGQGQMPGMDMPGGKAPQAR